MPSSRSRLSRSLRYFAFSASGSKSMVPATDRISGERSTSSSTYIYVRSVIPDAPAVHLPQRLGRDYAAATVPMRRLVSEETSIGGAGGIRTLDTAFQPYNGLANRRLQPLGHSSVRMTDTTSSPAPAVVARYCEPSQNKPAPGRSL